MPRLDDMNVVDPGHLSPDDRVAVEGLRREIADGADRDGVIARKMEECDILDATVEANVNGAIIAAIGTDITEPGYEMYPLIESVEVDERISRLVEQEYPKTMVALADGKMWTPDMEQTGAIRPPTLEEVIAILSSRLTEKQIKFMLDKEKVKDPKILLKALIGFGRYRRLLDTGTRLSGDGWEQKDTVVSDNRREKFAEEDREMNLNDQRIAGWKVGIGEGAERDPQTGILRDLLTKWNAELPEGVVLASPREHVLLMKLGIKGGKPIDERTWSPLRSDKNGKVIGEDGLVSVGRWFDAGPDFRGIDPVNPYNGAVCRPVVMEV